MRVNKLPFEVGENFSLSSSKTKKFKKNIHVIQCTYLSYILKHLVSNGTKYLRMDQVELWKTAFCLSKPYHFKFFKGCLPPFLLGPFWNTLSQISVILTSLSKYGKTVFIKVVLNV